MVSERDINLDFTKGVLVITMVLHHSMTYFAYISIYSKYIKYLYFVTGAFVFISGFIISSIYLNKYNIHETNIYRRLVSRGSKLLIICMILNILSMIINSSKSALNYETCSGFIGQFFLFGDWSTIAFSLLIPIAYTLFLSGLLIYALQYHLNIIIYVSLSFFIYCSIMFYDNKEAYYLRFITIGLCGLAAGLLSKERIEVFIDQKLLIFIAYLAYIVYISIYKQYYAIYVIGIIITLIFIYKSSRCLLKIKHNIFDGILLIGRYSLMLYIFQIFILQLLHRTTLLFLTQANNFCAAFLFTSLTMFIFAKLLDYLRSKSEIINKTYKVIFA